MAAIKEEHGLSEVYFAVLSRIRGAPVFRILFLTLFTLLQSPFILLYGVRLRNSPAILSFSLLFITVGPIGRMRAEGDGERVLWDTTSRGLFCGEDSGKCVCGACVGRLAATCAWSKIEDIYSDTP